MMCFRASLSAGPDAHGDASTTLTHAFQPRCSWFWLMRLKEDHPECDDDSTFMFFIRRRLDVFSAGYLGVRRDSENALLLYF